MNQQEVKDCLASLKLLQKAASSLQWQYISQDVPAAAFEWTCSIRSVLGALVMELSKNSFGMKNDADVESLLTTFERLLSQTPHHLLFSEE
jgi:hypothetical protein